MVFMTIKSAPTLLALVACAVPAFGFTVEVALLESSEARGAEPGLETSESVIEGALDGLFESGSIGTNSRPVAGSAASFLEYGPRKDSAEASIDFVIVILAEYAEAPESQGKASVPSCRYRLLRVADGTEVATGRLPAAAPASAALTDVLKACKSMGKAIASACGRVLSTSAASWRVHAYREA